MPQEQQTNIRQTTWPDARGRFGEFGGCYVPEPLMHPVEELQQAYREASADSKFQAELARLLREFAGRPTPLFYASRLTEHLGGARIYLKREDLLHTGAHKINNCLGQGLLGERMGKRRLIAETAPNGRSMPTRPTRGDIRRTRVADCTRRRAAQCRARFVRLLRSLS